MAPCADLRKLACTLWLCALPALAHAQSSDAGAAESTTPARDRTNTAAAEPAESAVLFLLPRDDEAAQAELRDALLAQFSLIQAQLVFAAEPEGEASLATRVQQAQALAAHDDAIAVFWIEAAADGRWLLHMMDTQDERVIVRQVDATGERRAAAVEAIAVMTRSGTRALIEGTPEALPAPTPAPVTGPSAASAAPPLDAFRLWLGYTGSAFAPEVVWQHGAALGATWLGPRPFFLGLSFTLAQAVERSGGTAKKLPATFSVQRTPIAAQFGYRYATGRVALDGELGLVVERWFRSSADARELTDATADPVDSVPRWVWELAPRVRGELRIASILGLYAGGGLDILLNKFTYVSRESTDRSLLNPNPFRPVAELGVSFYP